MPTYIHICLNEACNHEWEDYYSIKDDPPTTCPKCGKETAKRLISGGSGRGIVELTGHDLQSKLLSDAQKIKREARTNENVLADIIGHDKYQHNTKMEETARVEKTHLSNHFRRVKNK
jgi:putative FmdB family regulatory protein